MTSRHSRATRVNCALEAVLLAYLLQYTDDTQRFTYSLNNEIQLKNNQFVQPMSIFKGSPTHRHIKTATNNTFI